MVKFEYDDILMGWSSKAFLFEWKDQNVLNWLEQNNIEYSFGTLFYIITELDPLYSWSNPDQIAINGMFFCFENHNDELLFKLKFG